MRSGLFLARMLAASSLAAAETPLTIDQPLAQGWGIAGYARRVQCGVLYDVTRVPRTVVNCYELR